MKIRGHSSVTQGFNLIVIGGRSTFVESNSSANLYELTVENNQFKWREMDEKLKTPRRNFVASLIPAD